MIELLTGFTLTIVSLLIGFQLGKNQTVVSTDVKRQINQIFKKVVPKSEVGAVERPDAIQNFYRDNPQIAKEHEIMEKEFDKIV